MLKPPIEWPDRMWPEFEPAKLMILFPTEIKRHPKHGYLESDAWLVAWQGDQLKDGLEGTHFADQNLCDVPGGPGIWVWSGFAGWTGTDNEADFEFENGEWRRATDGELAALRDGRDPFTPTPHAEEP